MLSGIKIRCGAAALSTMVGLLCTGCETIPRVGDVPAADRMVVLSALQDQRPAGARVSRVEKSGARPIILLGDERFDVPPIQLLDRTLTARRPELRGCVVKQLDVRYLQGGSPDDFTTASAFAGAGTVNPVLGAIAYGAVSGMVRNAHPSEVQIVSDVACDGKVGKQTQNERLESLQESKALAELLQRAADRIVQGIVGVD